MLWPETDLQEAWSDLLRLTRMESKRRSSLVRTYRRTYIDIIIPEWNFIECCIIFHKYVYICTYAMIGSCTCCDKKDNDWNFLLRTLPSSTLLILIYSYTLHNNQVMICPSCHNEIQDCQVLKLLKSHYAVLHSIVICRNNGYIFKSFFSAFFLQIAWIWLYINSFLLLHASL